MQTVYRLNGAELDIQFLQALQTLFRDKEIRIIVTEVDESSDDETEYLLRSDANRTHLLQEIAHVENGQELVSVNLAEYQ